MCPIHPSPKFDLWTAGDICWHAGKCGGEFTAYPRALNLPQPNQGLFITPAQIRHECELCLMAVPSPLKVLGFSYLHNMLHPTSLGEAESVSPAPSLPQLVLLSLISCQINLC